LTFIITLVKAFINIQFFQVVV